MSIECTTSANRTVTCLYSADRAACVTGVPHSLQNLELGGSSVPHDPHGSPVAVSRTATIPAGVHVSIVSPLVNDVRHIAAPSPTRSFETLICRLIRKSVWATVKPQLTIRHRCDSPLVRAMALKSRAIDCTPIFPHTRRRHRGPTTISRRRRATNTRLIPIMGRQHALAFVIVNNPR